ncbi:MAG TPA: asparagine synthase-related protein, partial [Polyangiaceae bacterium]
MLLAVVDAGGAAAASAFFARVVEMAGQPRLRHGSGTLIMGAWGGSPSVGPDSSFVVEGRATIPEPGETSDPLERAACTRGDFALVGGDAHGVLLGSGGGGGYRPVYLATPARGRVVACTSLELLRALFGPPADPDVLATYATAATLFANRSPHPERTLYSGIERLPMYEAWHVDVAGRIRRCRTFRAMTDPERTGGADDLSRDLGDALRAAVRRAMSGHERVGVMASGGVDSSSLLAVSIDVARREAGGPHVDAFTWDYGTFYGDDRPHLRRLTDHLGIEPIRTTPRDAAWAVGATFVADGMPLYQSLSPLLATTGREARARGVTVLLNGAGGDDVLDGDPCLYAQLARSGHPARAVAGAVRLRGPYMGGPAWRVGQYVVRPLVRDVTPST